LFHYDIFIKGLSIEEKDDTVKINIDRGGNLFHGAVKLTDKTVTSGSSSKGLIGKPFLKETLLILILIND
jgi:hypothetical protein